MSKSTVELAKQGDLGAIATLINRALSDRGITAEVSRKDNCLRIILDSDEEPNKAILVDVIERGIKNLQIHGISSLQISGRQRGNDSHLWSQMVIFISQKEMSKNDKFFQEDQINKINTQDPPMAQSQEKSNGCLSIISLLMLISFLVTTCSILFGESEEEKACREAAEAVSVSANLSNLQTYQLYRGCLGQDTP